MVKFTTLSVAVATVAFATGPATAATPGRFTAAMTAVPTLTYATVAGINAGKTNGAYTGVGSLIITHASGDRFICTGSLVGLRAVVTAAHCLSDTDTDGIVDKVTAVSYYLPSYGERTVANTYNAIVDSWTVHPDYVPEAFYAGADIAMFALRDLAYGHDVYGIYQGDPLAQFTRVGTGTIGGPQGTGTGGVATDYKQRQGNNLYEYYGDEVFTDVGPNVLMSDFDDGTAAHDVFGQIGGNRQTGIAGESNSSPGDSGGPEFIDGQLVGITSWGSTIGAPIDPYGGTNSSIGELSGDTWVRPYQSFVTGFLADVGAVPEPATWLQMILGFGLIGGALRSARAKGVAA